jgi:hypothetical protein
LDSSTNKEQEEKSEQTETLNESEEIKRPQESKEKEEDVEMKEVEKVEFRTLKRNFVQESPKLTEEIQIPKPSTTNLLANTSNKRSPSEMTPTFTEESLEVASKKPKLKLKRDVETKSEDESEKEQTPQKLEIVQPVVVVAPTPSPPVVLSQPKKIEKVPTPSPPPPVVIELKPNVTLKTTHETIKKPTSTYAISKESIELRKNLDEFEQFLISIEKNL